MCSLCILGGTVVVQKCCVAAAPCVGAWHSMKLKVLCCKNWEIFMFAVVRC